MEWIFNCKEYCMVYIFIHQTNFSIVWSLKSRFSYVNDFLTTSDVITRCDKYLF